MQTQNEFLIYVSIKIFQKDIKSKQSRYMNEMHQLFKYYEKESKIERKFYIQ